MGSVTAQTQNIINYTVLLLAFLLIIVIAMDYNAGMFSRSENMVRALALT